MFDEYPPLSATFLDQQSRLPAALSYLGYTPIQDWLSKKGSIGDLYAIDNDLPGKCLTRKSDLSWLAVCSESKCRFAIASVIIFH